MRNMPVFLLRVVQFWMAAGLFAAMIVSTILAAPFLITGKIMDHIKGPYAKPKPGVYRQPGMGHSNI